MTVAEIIEKVEKVDKKTNYWFVRTDNGKYFDDFTPSNGCANESASYISLISNFFSWTKDIPWHEINVFGRGNTLYAVQRGHEPNTVDITTMRHTVPTVLRGFLLTAFCSMAMAGLRPPMKSTLGFSIWPKNWRA